MQLFLGKFKIEFKKIFGDYFFLLLLLTGIAVNYYFEMKVNRALKKFTADHEFIQGQRADAEQIFILGKAVTDFEYQIRKYLVTGDTSLLVSISEEEKKLNRSIVLVTEKIRNAGGEAVIRKK